MVKLHHQPDSENLGFSQKIGKNAGFMGVVLKFHAGRDLFAEFHACFATVRSWNFLAKNHRMGPSSLAFSW